MQFLQKSTQLSTTRQFGTALHSAGTLPRTRRTIQSPAARRIGGPLVATIASQQLLASLRHARYASTQPPPGPDGALPPAVARPAAPTEFSPSRIDLTGSELLEIPEQIGFLKALGLDYGWGPTSVVQWALEHIYIYTGLPWWASLALLAVAARAAIFKPSLTATAMQQKLQDLRKNPRYEAAMQAVKETMVSGDKMAAMAAQAELKQMNKAAGYQMWKTLIPMINIPIAFGVLRLIRGMAALPVPSLETGGALWFQDLTVADPYYILPLVTAGFLVRSMTVC